MAIGLACTLPVLGVLVYTLIMGGAVSGTETPAEPALSIAGLGEVLFTTHAPAVLAVAVLLTAVMIGAALFARDTDQSTPTDPS